MVQKKMCLHNYRSKFPLPPENFRQKRKTKILQEYPAIFIYGIGQSRTFILLLKKAHIGEVSATVWPKILKNMCKNKNIHVIE